MSWLDLFRKNKEPEEPINEISIEEAELLLEARTKKEKEQTDKTKEEMNKKVVKFISDLKEQTSLLNLIDLKEKREHEKIKFVTLQGLKEYIEQLNRFSGNLEKINKKIGFPQFMKEIDTAVTLFSKSSHKKLQKAQILIGEELAQTEEIIRTFHKEVGTIMKDNTGALSRMNNAGKLQNVKDLLHKTKETQREINNLISDLKEKKDPLITKVDLDTKEFNVFKESEEFISWTKEKENLSGEKQELDLSAIQLKEKIDVRSLLNKFHSVPTHLELLKGYRSDFLNALTNDKEYKILETIESNKRQIIEKELKDLAEKHQTIKEKQASYMTNEKEAALGISLKNTKNQIDAINQEIEEEKEKLTKFMEKEKGHQTEKMNIMEGLLDNVKIVDRQ
ncbi:hypothetical protein CMI48_00345 [Candidatus Pacearchaeota archaeon]|nr:hypothetical protein [Candidatus Pacearchaeota archaeon]